MPVVNVRTGAAYDVYIGRPGEWGNPYRNGTRCENVERYRLYLWRRMGTEEGFIERVAGLHGKVLGCWCAPDPCHGHILQSAAEWAVTRSRATGQEDT